MENAVSAEKNILPLIGKIETKSFTVVWIYQNKKK